MKQIIFAVIVLLFIGIGVWVFTNNDEVSPDLTTDEPNEMMPVEPDGGIGDGAGPIEPVLEGEEVVGQSVDGRDIIAYHFGTGEKEVLFVGGIHGGYSYNTAALSYEMVDYFENNGDMIPENVRVTIIPALNQDGLAAAGVTGTSISAGEISVSGEAQVATRFNTNDVDLNRNFDCEWEATGTWQNRDVSGGSEPFSEPESRAVRDYVESQSPAAVVAYYSAAGGVYASSCNNGVSSDTLALTNLYADAAEYPASESFDFYEVTGDMVNWVAKQNIPAISVLLSNRTDLEASRNIAGAAAVITYISENE